jgi:hypothetical protein
VTRVGGRDAGGAVVTDEQIRTHLETLPRGHYTTQWFLDALAPSSASHPSRKQNARAICAKIINDSIMTAVRL